MEYIFLFLAVIITTMALISLVLTFFGWLQSYVMQSYISSTQNGPAPP